MDSCCDPTHYDVAIVGSGSAAFSAALRVQERGARAIMIEAGTLGGTCVNIGCVPSKALIAVAERLHAAREPGFDSISVAPPRFDATRAATDRAALVAALRASKYEDVLASLPHVDLVRARARFDDAGRLVAGDRPIHADKIILAVGAAPNIPAVRGLAEVPFWTSTDAVEAHEVPASLIVWGGGYVGIELAQAWSRLGSEVTLVARGRLLSSEEPALGDALAAALRCEGMRVHTETAVLAVQRRGDRTVLTTSAGELNATRLLVATGRRSNASALNLGGVGVEVGPNGAIQVDGALTTTNPSIFAAGDCSTIPAYVYVAARAGRIAADNALGGTERQTIDISVVPRVVFSDPQVAAVGLTAAQAESQGFDVITSTVSMSEVPRAIVARQTSGLVMLVAERGSRRLIGAHVATPHAGEIILAATFALRARMTIDDISDTLHPYLTWGESLRLAAIGFDHDVTALSCCAG